MNPDDFLTLAIRLSNGSGEAEKRSAVSRAYYGSIHAARMFVASCGVQCPQSAEAHDKVAKCLQNCGDADAETAGEQLNTLRTARNFADYRLDDEQFRNSAYIRIQLARAQQIQTTLLKAESHREEIREPLRKYAHDILRMPLQSDD